MSLCGGGGCFLPSFSLPLLLDLSTPSLHTTCKPPLVFFGSSGPRAHVMRQRHKGQPNRACASPVPLRRHPSSLLHLCTTNYTPTRPAPKGGKRGSREQEAPNPVGQKPPTPSIPYPQASVKVQTDGHIAAHLVGGRRGRRGCPGRLALAGGVLLGGVLGDDLLMLRLCV